jgi:uncharacterized protein with PQ loop repeat
MPSIHESQVKFTTLLIVLGGALLLLIFFIVQAAKTNKSLNLSVVVLDVFLILAALAGLIMQCSGFLHKCSQSASV